MKKKMRLALIFDFDDTLAPDSTSQFLESLGLDVRAFWQSHAQLVQKGWDPIPAYLQMMLDESRARGKSDRITRKRFIEVGGKLKLYRGVRTAFDRIKRQVRSASPQVNLEYFVISSGIGEIIRASSIAGKFRDIWASDFAYNQRGEISAIKNVVSFTDKTRFLFYVQKGLVGRRWKGDPFAVNRKITSDQIHIPLRHMIVIGDGMTDVPCFSLIEKQGGTAIGVYDRDGKERWGKMRGLIGEKRVSHPVVADFTKNSGLDDAISFAIEHMTSRYEYS